jgi:hypothetical protein
MTKISNKYSSLLEWQARAGTYLKGKARALPPEEKACRDAAKTRPPLRGFQS